MNTAATSLSAYDLAFQSSTSHAQLSGAYSGSATSLTIKITAPTSISSIGSVVSFNVLDQNNNEVATYTGTITAGQTIDVGSTGLKVRFTAGSLGLNATATTNISQSRTDVSATALFNAGWGSAPLFEDYQQVSAGSFTINGVAITVNANDSINSVISRINSSSAGVTASVSSDKITIESSSYSEDNIVLANDTSGFLAATKLSGATATRGNVRDDEQVFSKTTQFSAVANGSFTINGVSIAVNKDTDSLISVISRINGSAAGVTASYDAMQDKVVLTTASNSEDLITVGSDTSGFLTAAKLSTTNTVRGNVRDDRQVLSKTTQFSSVTSGAFTINGVTISVNKDTDTVASIVTRINDSAAGVTATFNSSTNKIELVGTSNSEDLITVANDTSGFLSTAKLSTNNTVRGNIHDDEQVLAKTSQFGTVASGSFTINGVAISIDKDTDSISSIVTRINNANAGVTAAFNSSTNKLELTSASYSEDLITVANDTTGFLAATGLSTANTARGNLRDDQQALSSTSQFASVANGSFKINGVLISINTSQDTLQSVIAKINSAGAGVTAAYNTTSDKLVFTSTVAGNPLTVESDTSGFLSTAKIATGVTGMFQDGSFTVNGVSIAVTASDTLTSVLSKISASDAAVSGTYDSAAQTVKLTSKNTGATSITLGNDSSGFLTVARLDATAKTTTGAQTVRPFDSPITEFSEYSAVRTGTLTVNGMQIAIDPATTTVRTLVSALNSVSNLSATLEETTGRVRVSAKDADSTITLSDTSGIFSAFSMTAGTYRSTAGTMRTVQNQTGTETVSNATDVAAKVAAEARELKEAFSQFGAEVEAGIRATVDSLLDGEKVARDLKENAPAMTGLVDKLKDQIAKLAALAPQSQGPTLLSLKKAMEAYGSANTPAGSFWYRGEFRESPSGRSQKAERTSEFRLYR